MKNAILFFVVLISVIAGCLVALYFKFTGDDGLIIISNFSQPQLSRSYVPPSEVPSSRIAVPVKLSMSDLQSLANRNLIRQYNGYAELADRNVNGRLNYAVRREGDAKLTEENGRIKISLPVTFQVGFAGYATAAIARVPLSVRTEGALNIIITIKPRIERDWSITTEAEVDFAWLTSPHINVAGFRVGLQGESDRFLRNAIRDNLHKIDVIINEEIRLRDIMQAQWDSLAVPVSVADGVFLHFDPRSITASPIEVTQNEVALRASVETGISLSIGLQETPAREKSQLQRNLPPLEQHVPGDDSISLNVRALLNYDALEQEAMRALSGASVDLGVASIGVSSLRIMGSGENLVIAFELSAGNSRGTIFAVGKPYFDESARTLSIRNFDLEAGTRAGLVRAAAWLARPALLSFLSDRLEWKLGSQIDELTDETRRIIASLDLSDEFKLRGTLESAKFNGLRVTAHGIEIGLNLEGALALTYMPVY